MQRTYFCVVLICLLVTSAFAEPLFIRVLDSDGKLLESFTTDGTIPSIGTPLLNIPRHLQASGNRVLVYSTADTTRLLTDYSAPLDEHVAYADQAGWAHIAATAQRTQGTTWADSSDTANWAWDADSANFAWLADSGRVCGNAWTANIALWADTAAYATAADTATYADTASFAITALSADSAIFADTASYADSALYSDTAGYAMNVLSGDSGYIFNQDTAAQSADFWISGTAQVDGGLTIDSPANDAIWITMPDSNGIIIDNAGDEGIVINSPVSNGMHIDQPGDNGIYIFALDYPEGSYGILSRSFHPYDTVGYFDGNVHITGDLSVDGSVPATVWADSAIWADTAGYALFADSAGYAPGLSFDKFLTVAPTGGDFNTIADALDSVAAAGGEQWVVRVMPGEYFEVRNSTLPTLVTLVGYGPDVTAIYIAGHTFTMQTNSRIHELQFNGGEIHLSGSNMLQNCIMDTTKVFIDGGSYNALDRVAFSGIPASYDALTFSAASTMCYLYECAFANCRYGVYSTANNVMCIMSNCISTGISEIANMQGSGSLLTLYDCPLMSTQVDVVGTVSIDSPTYTAMGPGAIIGAPTVVMLDQAYYVGYDNTISGLAATDAQSAIDEIDAAVDGILAGALVTDITGGDGIAPDGPSSGSVILSADVAAAGGLTNTGGTGDQLAIDNTWFTGDVTVSAAGATDLQNNTVTNNEIDNLSSFTISGLVVNGDAGVTGKLTVGGGIDPTYLALTPQVADPEPTTLQKLWIDNTNQLIYDQDALNSLVIIATTTGTITSAEIANNSITSSHILDNEIVNADVNATANVAATKLDATVMVETENVSLLTNDAGYLTTAITSANALTGPTLTFDDSGGLTVVSALNTITYTIGAGNGITVNADDIEVDYGVLANTAVEGSQTATITAGAGLTGDMPADALGDGFSATINVGAGNGITVNANDIEVDYGVLANTAVEGSQTATITAGAGLTGGIAADALGDGFNSSLAIDNTWFSGDVTVSAGGITDIQAGTIGNTEIDNADDITVNNITTTNKVSAGIAVNLPFYSGASATPPLLTLPVENQGDMIFWQDTGTLQFSICIFDGAVWKCTNVN